MPNAPIQGDDGPKPGLAAKIAIAGFKQVYSTGRVETALDELPLNANEALRSTYEKMLRAGGERFCVKPGILPDFDALEPSARMFDDDKDIEKAEGSGDHHAEVVIHEQIGDILPKIVELVEK